MWEIVDMIMPYFILILMALIIILMIIFIRMFW